MTEEKLNLLTHRGDLLTRVASVFFFFVPLGLLLFSLVLRYSLVSKLNVHWDELNFLNHVHLYVQGEQTKALQTFHGPLFAWLTRLEGTEIDQIVAGRYAMFGFTVVTAAMLGHLGHRLIGGSAGVFSAFCAGSFAFVLHHGTSFRYDPIVVMAYLGAAALLVLDRRQRLAAGTAGVVMGLALLISIKSVFYLPPLVLVAAAPVLLPDRRREALLRTAVFGATAASSFALLFSFHRALLPRVDVPSMRIAESAADKMFSLNSPFPRSKALLETLRWDTPMWALLLLGLVVVGGSLTYGARRERVKAISVLALGLPLLSLYLYRNSWPYFYVSVLPGAALLAGALWRRLEVLALRRPILAGVLALAMAVPTARTAWLWFDENSEDRTKPQRDLVAAVHEIFQEPVPYIDRCGMIASFPKLGPFMTSWSMGNYRSAGTPVMEALIKERQPKLLLANVESLELNRPYRKTPPSHRWLKKDYGVLQQNFIHHWGDIWVAGKRLTASHDDPTSFRMLIEGRYTVEAKTAVEVDGALVEPHHTVELSRGVHQIKAVGDHDVAVKLRWGDNLVRPKRRPERGRIFWGFRWKRPKQG